MAFFSFYYILATFTVAFAVLSGCSVDAKSKPAALQLGSDYPIETSKITISGFSSGSSFSHMFHIIHSQLISGVGILAGLYYEYDGPSAGKAKEDSGDPTDEEGIAKSVALIKQYSSEGLIDSPENLRDAKIYIWAGTADTRHNLAQRLGGIVTIYEPYLRDTSQLVTKVQLAKHKYPSAVCAAGEEKKGYQGYCHYDARPDMFSHLLDIVPQVSTGPFNELQEFDQTEFFEGITGEIAMNDKGLIYVPTECQANSSKSSQTKCFLHFFFHGCSKAGLGTLKSWIIQQNFLGIAEGSNIIMVFPKNMVTTASPLGCWDFRGWTGPKHATNQGNQVRVVRSMIERLTGK